MMKEDQKRRHGCRVCGRSFVSGRALGGHMRSHLAAMAAAAPANDSAADSANQEMIGSRRGSVFGGGGGSSYMLREKPKKKSSWTTETMAVGSGKAVVGDPSAPAMSVMQCRKCGKCFSSRKALYGHMRCHSPKSSCRHLDRAPNREGIEVQPDDDGLSSTTRKIKKSMETTTATSSFDTSEEAHDLQITAAATVILLMLSEDTRPWEGISCESSNYSSSADDHDPWVDVEEADEKIEGRKRKSWKKKKDHEYSHISNDDGEIKMCGSYLSDDEDEDNNNKSGIRFSKMAYYSREEKQQTKRVSSTEDGEAVGENPSPVASHQQRVSTKKNKTYKCSICDKVFQSYQALGGHRAGNKRYPGGCRRIVEAVTTKGATTEEPPMIDDYNAVDGGGGTTRSCGLTNLKHIPHHQCPICGKIFHSGQALGGHKRSHGAVESSIGGYGDDSGGRSYMQSATEADERPINIVVEIPSLLDLNLPAKADEESDKIYGVWWDRA